MNYKIDVSLSTNEVYTLMFDYTFDESVEDKTIRLQIGDLMVETQDRRVVFKTTSSATCIKSNVRLENVNLYEGNFLDYDQHGEYTKESYLKGATTINLVTRDMYDSRTQASVTREFTEDGFRKITKTENGSSNMGADFWARVNFVDKSIPEDWDTVYTVIVFVRKNTFPSDISLQFNIRHKNTNPNLKGEQEIIIKGGDTGIYKSTSKIGSYNQSLSGRYWGCFSNAWSDTDVAIVDRTDLVGCTLEYAVMVVKGDYYDDDITIGHFFEGVGCVKSPKILSETKHRNIMLNTKPRSTTSSITVSDDNTYIYLAESARHWGLNFDFTQEYLAQYGISNGDKLCIELDGRLIEGTGTQAAKTSTRIGIDACAWSDGSSGIGTVYKNLPENGHFCDYITINYNAGAIGISFLNNPDWTGTNKIYEIQNFRVYKIEDKSEVGTYDCCEVTTPDDLELYKVNDTTYDKLDLTTGILYKNTGTYVLDETFVDRTSNWEVSIHDTTGNVTFISRQHKYLRDEHNFPYSLYNNAIVSNADPASNIVNNSNIKITRPRLYFDIHSNNNYTVIIMPASYNVTTLEELRTWLQNNPMIFNYKLGTPYTEQLSLNPLKSYKNGSIQTSSQQLIPTLKTTLPISNKFTTTNLTSGSTYNVYFDGTATKLDAGGTIITNPISPCEVECGGTTLTIEGTDIQNVRVLETTVKNEVGSVVGTTDVELSRVITSDLEVITNDIEFSSVSTANGNINTVDNKLGTINTKGGHYWGAGSFTSNKTYPKGFSLLHVEFDVDMPSDNLMAIINFNNNVGNTYYNFRDLTLDNDTATIAQGLTSGVGVRYSSIVTKGHFSRLMYCFSSQGKINLDINTGSSAMTTASGNNAEGSTSGYTACANNGVTISNFKIKVIENYPDTTNSSQITSSLRTDNGLTVIWQDMDMSIGQSICDLEQPIKLRSLGTTYDSYNPVTGELVKRISVSETDGSYSVLSSPVISQAPFGRYFTNIFDINTDMIRNWTTTPTVNGNEITIKGTWYTSFGVPFENGKQYTLFYEMVTNGRMIVLNNYENQDSGIIATNNNNWSSAGTKDVLTFTYKDDDTSTTGGLLFYASPTGTTYKNIMVVEGKYSYDDLPYFEGTQFIKCDIPHLYTNGQVKVYSDSDVYPTAILNGQSTNNYEINELNTSNNYTIRYDGTCESINLNGKSNEQGTNRIVKTSTNGSGNLTFINDSGDIDNVLLVQNDVREQEINHFNGLQTVEVSRIIVQSPISKHLFYNHDLNDFVPSVNTNYSFDENNNLVLSNGYGNYVDTMLQTVDKYTLEKGDSVIFRVVGIENFAADHRLIVKLATQNLAFGGYHPESYVNFKAPKVQEIINEQGYCDVVYAYNSETTTDNIQISNYFGKWIISSVVLCKQSQEIITPIIINLPQPVQLNSLPDGTCDTYNPITGEYVQRVNGKPYTGEENWHRGYLQFNCISYNLELDKNNPKFSTSNYYTDLKQLNTSAIDDEGYFLTMGANYTPILTIRLKPETLSGISFEEWLVQSGIVIFHAIKPITTQLTPITIPTFEGGIVHLITTDGKVFPMIEYSMPTNNRYDTSSWEAGAVYTQRNMTEVYFNESTTPMIPTETTTLTTDHISSGSIILNDNGNGLIVLKGNYTGRDIPYFTGMRSVESIEIETSCSSDQPLFGKGGRK